MSRLFTGYASPSPAAAREQSGAGESVALTRDMIARARWTDDHKLVAARRDGGAVLATLDTSDQWCYQAALCTGAACQGWPMDPVRRLVRQMLRASIERQTT